MSENPTLKTCAILIDFVSRHAMLAVAGLALSLAVAAGPAAAQNSNSGKKGPRASVSAATVCALDGTDFTVEIRVRDKTSGDAIPLVSAWNVDASYLERGEPGNQWQTFQSAGESGVQLSVPTTISSTFSLCAATGGIRPELVDARALNGLTLITYGKDDGAGGVADTRNINNKCSDDPETLEVIEPAGIKLTEADIYFIDVACALTPPDSTALTDTSTTTTDTTTTTESTTETTATTDPTTTTATTESTTETTTATDPTTTGL